MPADASTSLVVEGAFVELVRAESERNHYRELLCLALTKLYMQSEEIRRMREQYTRLLSEYRTLREQRMREAA